MKWEPHLPQSKKGLFADPMHRPQNFETCEEMCLYCVSCACVAECCHFCCIVCAATNKSNLNDFNPLCCGVCPATSVWQKHSVSVECSCFGNLGERERKGQSSGGNVHNVCCCVCSYNKGRDRQEKCLLVHSMHWQILAERLKRKKVGCVYLVLFLLLGETSPWCWCYSFCWKRLLVGVIPFAGRDLSLVVFPFVGRALLGVISFAGSAWCLVLFHLLEELGA